MGGTCITHERERERRNAYANRILVGSPFGDAGRITLKLI
jgi:hypothetical protein